MTTLSVSVPDDLKRHMEALEEVNWSAVARKAFEEKVVQVEMMKKIISKSKLTEKDAEAIGNKISKAASKRFMEMR